MKKDLAENKVLILYLLNKLKDGIKSDNLYKKDILSNTPMLKRISQSVILMSLFFASKSLIERNHY